ncbi:alpha-amylase family glycosyl hydrolase [Actinospica robiniae]|uniref:alpha-amylase family glycosyl hydrolase n=1 Tax=Actinospica robiniae TaxID=304901 RepID=UPI0005533A43
MTSPPAWLADAVLYQIYPQSFADSNGDGIGDLPGIRGRLDYLSDLGVNTLWLSPLFASPFFDAGYDVSDYQAVAPRYGTEQDLVELVRDAGERGIRILLDLVAGHTSDQHPWFRASANTPPGAGGGDRYVWAETAEPPDERWVASPGARPGYFLPNFYAVQPALNFGYARMDQAEPWRQPVDAPGPRANRAALREIMAYWFDRGVAGFRVDMAASLVEDDPGRAATAALWGEMRAWMDEAYPDKVLISEWGDPKTSVPAGFHADFFLHFVGRPLRSLWGNAQGSHAPNWGTEPCYFAPEGGGALTEFLAAWLEADEAIDGNGHAALPTANHDFSRLTCGTRTRAMVAPAFAFLLTWPTLPVIYYGDEIGMRYIPGLPDKEGSQLNTEARQGSRTPMQWAEGGGAGGSAGFSTAPADRLYLPIDPAPDRPTVHAEQQDPDSLLNQVKALIRLRKARPELATGGTVRMVHDGYPGVYVRGERYVVILNPSARPERFDLPDLPVRTPLIARGVVVEGGVARTEPFGYGIFELEEKAGLEEKLGEAGG